jgi:hypothetical protein
VSYGRDIHRSRQEIQLDADPRITLGMDEAGNEGMIDEQLDDI